MMIGLTESVQNQELWKQIEKQDSLFPYQETEGTTDLIAELESKLDDLEDLCGRLSFSIREVNQVLKAKSSSY
jgi:hypothetical protein